MSFEKKQKEQENLFKKNELEFLISIQKKDYDEIVEKLIKKPSYFKNFGKKLRSLIKIEKDSVGEFRHQIIRHFASFPEPSKNSKQSSSILAKIIKHQIGDALKVELFMMEKQKFLSREQVNKLCFYLDTIYKLKLKNLLYEIVAYSAFPLRKVRIKCWKALSFMNDDQILPFVMKMSSSKSNVERIYALEAFYYLRDERMISILLNSLKDENKSVRYYAMTTLEKLGRAEAIPMFVRMIQSDGNDEVREKAIRMLKKTRPNSGFYAIMESLRDDNLVIRKASLETALAYRNSKAAYHISLQLPRETNAQFKLSQVKALLQFNSSGGTRGLSSLLNEKEDTSILRWFIYVAGELKDYFSFSKIIKFLKHKKLTIRIEASVAIGKYRDARSTPFLMNILENPNENYQVQIGALYSLKKINYRAVSSQLRKILNTHTNIYLRAQIKNLFFSKNK